MYSTVAILMDFHQAKEIVRELEAAEGKGLGCAMLITTDAPGFKERLIRAHDTGNLNHLPVPDLVYNGVVGVIGFEADFPTVMATMMVPENRNN